MIYCAWKHGGADPYLLFNGPGAGPPPHPERVTQFILGCGMYAEEREVELATGKNPVARALRSRRRANRGG